MSERILSIISICIFIKHSKQSIKQGIKQTKIDEHKAITHMNIFLMSINYKIGGTLKQNEVNV